MKFLSKSTLTISVLCVAALSSCTTAPTALTSKPPVKALKVQNFTHGDGFLIKKFHFPADTYFPTMEDKRSYFYSPPGGQVKVFDTGMTYSQQGGITIDKNSEVPNGIYIKGLGGMYGKLKKDNIPAQVIK